MSFGAKNVQKTKFEAAEMILDPWNQQRMPVFNERDHGKKFQSELATSFSVNRPLSLI